MGSAVLGGMRPGRGQPGGQEDTDVRSDILFMSEQIELTWRSEGRAKPLEARELWHIPLISRLRRQRQTDLY